MLDVCDNNLSIGSDIYLCRTFFISSFKIYHNAFVDNIVDGVNICLCRFSGITDQDLKGVKTTLRDVQAVLLSLFSQKTVLMGHSLESDLIALKLIHDTVVDTSVVFPHRLGAPYKRALRTLMGEILQKIIQNDGETFY